MSTTRKRGAVRVAEGGVPHLAAPAPGPAQPGRPAAVQVLERVRLRQGARGGGRHRGRHLRDGSPLLRPAGRSRARPGALPHSRPRPARRAGQDHGSDQAGADPPEPGGRGGRRSDGRPHHADLGLLLGCSTGSVGKVAVALRHQGELLALRGYVEDMGEFPTHKAAIVRLYLSGITTPAIAARTYHSKEAVDRYIRGFERVRLLAAKHPREELLILTGMSMGLINQYLVLMEENRLAAHPEKKPGKEEGSHAGL